MTLMEPESGRAGTHEAVCCRHSFTFKAFGTTNDVIHPQEREKPVQSLNSAEGSTTAVPLWDI